MYALARLMYAQAGGGIRHHPMIECTDRLPIDKSTSLISSNDRVYGWRSIDQSASSTLRHLSRVPRTELESNQRQTILYSLCILHCIYVNMLFVFGSVTEIYGAHHVWWTGRDFFFFHRKSFGAERTHVMGSA